MLRKLWHWLMDAPEPVYVPVTRKPKKCLNMAAHKLPRR
jgi:hypothetical protein